MAYEELVKKFFEEGRLKILKSSKINQNIYILATKNSAENYNDLMKVKSYIAHCDRYVVDENDFVFFDESMSPEKIISILDAIKSKEGEKFGN